LLKNLKIGGDSTDLDYDLQTKSGQSLRFVYTECVSGTNRCYKLDEIAAFLGETKVGYILVENVPRAIFDAYMPSALHHHHRIEGHLIFPGDTEELPLDQLSVADLQTLAHRITFEISWPGKDTKAIQSYDDFCRWMETDIEPNKWFAKVQSNYTEFQSLHVDRPKVGYVRTKGDAQGNRGLFGDYSGEGVGLALYQVAAMEMAKRGMEFFLAIQTASGDAQTMHHHFEKAGWIVKVDDRIRLDGEAIAADLGIDLQASPHSGPV
jgi:hypothetical protein